MTSSPDDGLTWALHHLPDNMKQTPQQWTTPYDTVLTCFTGDWYDAAMIYRSWALKQTWTARGPLAMRDDIPQWFKDIDNWIMWPITKKPTNLIFEQFDEGLYDGLNIGLMVTYWGKDVQFDRQTPDRFPLPKEHAEFFAETQRRGIPVNPYLQGICWSMGTESFTENHAVRNAVRNYEQQVICWPPPDTASGHEGAVIAYPGQVWQAVLGDTLAKMAETGMDSAYLDSFNHAGTYLNFNPIYSGDACGGGNGYIKDVQRMADALKQRLRQIKPGFCFTAESFWEGNMAQLDAYLTVNTTNQPLNGDHLVAIPLAQAVYHDHTIFYAGWINRADQERDDAQAWFAKWGQMFTWGVKNGWDQPHFFTRFENHEITRPAFVERMHAYKTAKKWLLYGTLLRQPAVVNALPQIENIKWFRGWSDSYYNVTMPAVLLEAWRAPDGELAVVLYNISPKDQAIQFALTAADHGVQPAGVNDVETLWPTKGSAEVQIETRGDQLLVATRVASRSPMVVRFSAKKQEK